MFNPANNDSAWLRSVSGSTMVGGVCCIGVVNDGDGAFTVDGTEDMGTAFGPRWT